VEKQPLEGWPTVSEGMWTARCGKCGSLLRRSYEEHARGGMIDSLRILRAEGLADVGARVELYRLYRCRPWEVPGPSRAGLAIASRA
jgi:hypothetical protein